MSDNVMDFLNEQAARWNEKQELMRQEREQQRKREREGQLLTFYNRLEAMGFPKHNIFESLENHMAYPLDDKFWLIYTGEFGDAGVCARLVYNDNDNLRFPITRNERRDIDIAPDRIQYAAALIVSRMKDLLNDMRIVGKEEK